MQTLKIKNLSYQYPNSSLAIFDQIDLEFEKGWSAVVGSNGSGKTTLLKLISEEIRCDAEMIKANRFIYYCPQSTEYPPKDFENFMMTFTSKAFRIKDLLAIKDEWFYQWDRLSDGERKRVHIAVALFLEPDILLIDEPTNHLDRVNRHIVFQALLDFNGIGILVSHDRELMDILCHSTVLLKNSKAYTYKMNYSRAMEEHRKSIHYHQKIQSLHNDEIKKLTHAMHHQYEKIQQSGKRLSKKHLDIHDSDGREKINAAKLTGKDKNDGQMLKSMQSKLKQLSASSLKVEKESKTGITIESSGFHKGFPIVIDANTLPISDIRTLAYPRLSINGQDKIGLIGENGSGKSSFLKYVLSRMEFPKDSFLYIPQEIPEHESKKLLEEVNALSKADKGNLLTIIKRLSSEPERVLNSSIPSPGETRKLLLAKGLLQKPSLIILDEPTNHMDVNSIEALESALEEYQGTLIIISHDNVFLDRLTTITWSFIKKGENLYSIEEMI